MAEHLGSDTFFHVHDTGLGEPLTVRASGEIDLKRGATIHLAPREDKIHKFNAQGLRLP